MGSISDSELLTVAQAAQPRAMSPSGATPSDRFTAEAILTVHAWASTLFSLRTSRYRGFRFTPGQFSRLSVARDDGSIVWRSVVHSLRQL